MSEVKNIKNESTGLSSLRKAWEVLFPYLLYYLAYSTVYIILAFVQAATVAGVTGGLSMMLGVLPIIPMFKKELLWLSSMNSDDTKQGRGRLIKEILFTGILAFCSSLGLNVLLTLTGFADSSQTYREVADNQYGVAFAAGLFLYGLISPLAEEVVFRGVIFNRMRRFYGPVLAIVASGLFFGAFHGNIVQGVYGGCMGILMACLYEKNSRFVIPFFFHMVSNLAVYITAYVEPLQEVLFTVAGCVVLLVAAGCVWIVWKRDGE